MYHSTVIVFCAMYIDMVPHAYSIRNYLITLLSFASRLFINQGGSSITEIHAFRVHASQGFTGGTKIRYERVQSTSNHTNAAHPVLASPPIPS